jgi:hypothetical protein
MAEAFRVDTIRNVVISSQDSSAIRLSPEIKVVIEKGQVCLFSLFIFSEPVTVLQTVCR